MKFLLTFVALIFLYVNGSPQQRITAKKIKKVIYKGNYPKNKKGNWTENLQGVSNNKNYWFFTQNEALWKVPVTFDLRKSRHLSSQRDARIKKADMPEILAEKGYNHFGDPDNYNGFLFIPVEKEGANNTPPVIAVFQEADLNFIGYDVLDGKKRAGWCTVNPATQDLLTSQNKINQDNSIDIYKINWSGLKDKHRVSLVHKGIYVLKNLPGSWNGVVGRYIQGGDFSDDGRFLFILNGKIGDGVQGKGISIYRNSKNDIGYFLQASGQNEDFEFEFHPDFPKYEEPEGLTYWNLTGIAPAAFKGGQLHAILLNKEAGDDGLYLKHYEIIMENLSSAEINNVRFVQ